MRNALIIITCLMGTAALAQEDSTVQEKAGKTTLTLAALYNTNASYYGQTAKEKMPYVAANATLRFPSGFYFSALGFRLLNQSSDFVSAGNLGLGFEFPLARNLTADLSYSHYFYPANSTFLQAANTDIASATLSLSHAFTTSLNADFAFGKQTDIFLTLGNAKQFQLGSLLSNKEIWTLTPAIDITAGTQRFYETYITRKIIRDSILGLPLPGRGRDTETTTTNTKSDFNLLSYNLRVPLAYNRASYLVEAAYQVSLLGSKVETDDRSARHFFSLSFYYQF